MGSNDTTYTGQLKRWNDSKGFGFIGSEDEDRDIFIHISELKHMTRRPSIGDTITYQIQVQDDGKNRAVNANIDGVKKHPSQNAGLMGNTPVMIGLAIVVIAVIGYFAL
ncbi:MAG: cold shock domain-containing protein [Gammaproteobacteria bacterium]|nr:cold shock domain-containing protein [Gammaproteobacteria bacterium]